MSGVWVGLVIGILVLRWHGWLCDPKSLALMARVGRTVARVVFGSRWRERL